MERTYGDLQDKNRIISEQKVISIPWCVDSYLLQIFCYRYFTDTGKSTADNCSTVTDMLQILTDI